VALAGLGAAAGWGSVVVVCVPPAHADGRRRAMMIIFFFLSSPLPILFQLRMRLPFRGIVDYAAISIFSPLSPRRRLFILRHFISPLRARHYDFFVRCRQPCRRRHCRPRGLRRDVCQPPPGAAV